MVQTKSRQAGSPSCCAISEENKRWNQSEGLRMGSLDGGGIREGEKMVPAWQQKWLPGWPENAWTSRQKTMPSGAAEVDPAAGGRSWPASGWRGRGRRRQSRKL